MVADNPNIKIPPREGEYSAYPPSLREQNGSDVPKLAGPILPPINEPSGQGIRRTDPLAIYDLEKAKFNGIEFYISNEPINKSPWPENVNSKGFDWGVVIKKLYKKIMCWLLGHNWTCAAIEGIEPTDKQIEMGMAGFLEYSQMYCKRCAHEYEPR